MHIKLKLTSSLITYDQSYTQPIIYILLKSNWTNKKTLKLDSSNPKIQHTYNYYNCYKDRGKSISNIKNTANPIYMKAPILTIIKNIEYSNTQPHTVILVSEDWTQDKLSFGMWNAKNGLVDTFSRLIFSRTNHNSLFPNFLIFFWFFFSVFLKLL